MAAPPLFSVTYPLESPPPEIHCPLCGRVSRKMRTNRDPAEHCPHLLMIYYHKNKECVYLSGEIRNRLVRKGLTSSADEEIDGNSLLLAGRGSIPGALELLGFGSMVWCLELSFGRMEDSAVWNTTTYCFDFAGKE